MDTPGWFYRRAGSEGWYNGARLAESGDVVVVTINHRLNIYGYLYLADLSRGKYAASGLNGMLDAVLALQWVQDNIEEFGGDPGNVTLFGESGGGAKVSTRLALPRADGLFHKAIIQSGPGLTGLLPATAFAEKVLDYFSIRKEDIDKIQELSIDQINEAFQKIAGAGPTAAGTMHGTGGGWPSVSKASLFSRCRSCLRKHSGDRRHQQGRIGFISGRRSETLPFDGR